MAVDVTEESNLILLLGLDPSREWTIAEVNAELDQKRSEWNSRSSQVGKLADEARRYRDVLRKLKLDMILASSSALAEHLHKAREISGRRRKQYEDALDEEIRFASAKGYLASDEKEDLQKRYAERVSPEYLDKHLGSIQVTSLESRETISELTLKQIDALLASVNESSLYSFLGLPNTAPNEQLVQAANAKLQIARQRKHSDQQDLAGHAIVIFSDDARRAQYTRHAAEVWFMQSVLAPYLLLCDLTKEITLEQAEYLLQRARNVRWEDGEAQQMLFSIALSRGWRVQVPAARSAGISAAQQRLVDELRKELNEAREQKDALDHQRRKDIKNLADSERRRKEAELKAREASEDRERVRQRLRAELDKAKQQAEQQQAYVRVLEERERATEWQLTDLRDGTAKNQEQLKKLSAEKQHLEAQLREARARQHEKEQERVAEFAPRLTTYIARHELIAARAIIQSFSQVPPQWQTDAQRIKADISEATRLFQQAKTVASVDPLSAEQLLESALALCADLEDAVQLRRRLQPIAPSELDMAPDEQGVVISWSASPSTNVRYVVIRKEGSKPASIHDGARIAETSATRCRDDTPPPARTLRYAVYAERENNVSTIAAHARKSLFLMPEVADLRCDVEDGRITLLWRSPEQVSAIIVVRREGTPPRGIDDGKRYELGSTERFQDSDVQNDARYYYRVYCEYLDAAHATHHSEGKLIDAIAEAPPQEVPALEVRGSQGIISHTISLITQVPLRGELRIYRSDEAPNVPALRKVPAHALNNVFGRTGRSLREMSDTLIRAMHVFYTPVIIFHDTAYLGEPHEYTYAPRLTNVRAETAEQTIRVQWKWAIDCEGAEVSCAPLGVHTMNPRVEYVACIEGNSTNPHLELRGMPRGDYDIAVRAQYRLGNRTVFSDLEHVSVHVIGPVVIRYAVHRQNRIFAGRQYEIALSASEPLLSPLPPVIVVRGADRAPTSPDDGERVPVPAAERRDDSTWIISLNGIALHSNTWLAVFPASAQQQDIRYEPESLESQRIP